MKHEPPRRCLPLPSFAIPTPVQGAETTAWAQRAERVGMRGLWFYDVPGEWPDPYPHIALALHATERLAVGPLVSTPALREPRMLALSAATLQALSGGRFEMALGRGDAAVRALGQEPCSLAGLEAAVRMVRYPLQGSGVAPSEWLGAMEIPTWVGTYGPLGLRLAGRVASGIILQLTDVDLIRWALELVAQGAAEAGRSPRELRVMVACAASPGRSVEDGLAQVRWFVRMIVPDLVRLVQRGAVDRWPVSLRHDLEQWAALGLAEDHGLELRIADRLCLLGTQERCRERLALLAAAGVDEVVVYQGDGDLGLLDAWAACWAQPEA